MTDRAGSDRRNGRVGLRMCRLIEKARAGRSAARTNPPRRDGNAEKWGNEVWRARGNR